MYAIKINKTHRYISYCDECWYETSEVPIYVYTKDQALAIAEQMKNHYVYSVTISDREGNSEIVGTNPMKETVKAAPAAKSFRRTF